MVYQIFLQNNKKDLVIVLQKNIYSSYTVHKGSRRKIMIVTQETIVIIVVFVCKSMQPVAVDLNFPDPYISMSQ